MGVIRAYKPIGKALAGSDPTLCNSPASVLRAVY